MARRRSYKKDERLLTRILLADVAIFILYMLFAGLGVAALKTITAIIAIIGSLLCLGYLFMRGEIMKPRSRWLVYGFAAIALLVVVSLILNYPSPAEIASGVAGTSTIPTGTSSLPTT